MDVSTLALLQTTILATIFATANFVICYFCIKNRAQNISAAVAANGEKNLLSPSSPLAIKTPPLDASLFCPECNQLLPNHLETCSLAPPKEKPKGQRTPCPECGTTGSRHFKTCSKANKPQEPTEEKPKEETPN